MPEGFKIDTSEILELGNDFQRAGGRVGREVAAVVRKTTTAVERSAERNAPVGETGDLKRGIQQEIKGSGRGAEITGNVFSDVPYARFVEEGTSRNRPQPWLGPAVNEHEDAFNRSIEKIIEGALDE
jgi:HK97 gp10 family phage protein